MPSLLNAINIKKKISVTLLINYHTINYNLINNIYIQVTKDKKNNKKMSQH